MYEIRDDIKKPEAKHPSRVVYPINDLKVDQSFIFPIEKIDGVRSSVQHWRQKSKKRFVVFRYSDTEGACMRIK